MNKKLCGKPAVYFGYLDVTPYYGLSNAPVRPAVVLPLSHKPFCAECTRIPPDPGPSSACAVERFRPFVKERDARPGETCAAPVAA